MADPSRARGADREPVPPIEIGSFIALQPDMSEFIGSASGVFFANTVLRAFAAAPSGPAAAEPGGHVAPPDPDSAHSYLAAAETGQEEQAEDGDGEDSLLNPVAPSGSSSHPSSPPYGVSVRGLGRPPSPEAAKELLMLYFRNWHPFFPFLHGPTFFNQVNGLYAIRPGRESDSASRQSGTRSRLCGAVTFQCVFNIAASAPGGQHHLVPESRIKSVLDLTGYLGTVSSSHDIASLQALLAMELYLMTRMAVRAASTVHGILTRMLYHGGFHRCPHRYVQLPGEKRDIRQRIFWCAYILDRQLSQSLGHPLAFVDKELDVCIPGMTELHKPVRPQGQTSTNQDAPEDETQAHLPRTPGKQPHAGNEAPTRHSADPAAPGSSRSLDIQSPAYHYATSPERVGEYVMGYLATYSRLVGVALDLFHQSIHSRSITRDKVSDITCRAQLWWNNLPPALQDGSESGSATSKPRYDIFFAVAYDYLIIFINRPFLSLPTNRMDFKCSLQSAISSSRVIIRALRDVQNCPMLFGWPGLLSAVWMSGLVVAYASLLEFYPLEKAVSGITSCLLLLDGLGSSWPSARHCQAVLKNLLDRLRTRSAGGQPGYQPMQGYASGQAETGDRISTPWLPTNHPFEDAGRGSKRRRTNGDAGAYVPSPPPAQWPNLTLGPDMTEAHVWQPVLEYTGPDFGFDADHMANRGAWQGQGQLDQGFDVGTGGLFDVAEWDAYVQGFGDRLNF